MEFPYGFWEHGATKCSFLDQTVSFSEPAGIAGDAITERDGVDHAIAVEYMVAGEGLIERIGSVSDVDALYAFGDFPGDRE